MQIDKLFQGRINRKNFILSWLLITVVFLGALFFCYSVFPEKSTILISSILCLFIIRGFFGISLAIRRFHDFNQSGAWVWLIIIV